MPRADRSIPFLTGLIIAGLYVILLVGFTRESYMRRDALARASAADRFVVQDAARPTCRFEPAASAPPPNTVARPKCITPADIAREPANGRAGPTLEALRRAMRDELSR